MKALRTWLALTIHEKSLVIEAWFDLLVVAALLRTPLHRRLMRPQEPFAQHESVLIQPEVAIRLVDAAARFHIKKMTCLERTLVARRVLRRRGKHVTLRLGVSRVSGQVEAHAWLEQDGQPLDERAAQYSVLRELGA